MKKTVFYLLMCLIFCVSCQDEDPQLPEIGAVETCSSAGNVTFRNSSTLAADSDIYGIEAYMIDGDCLNLDVVYSGGCAEHNFVLYANEKIDSSGEFPTRKISLHHSSNKDNCSAQLNKKLIYNLAPIQLDNFDKIYVLIEGVSDTLVYDYYKYNQSIAQQ